MIGIIAPSSVVPQVELALGVKKLNEQGFSVRVHPQCKKLDWYFSGTDEQRAQAFFEYAQDPEISVLWAARGGYGAIRVLPLLDELSRRLGSPAKKLLVGYSDLTVLMEYVRTRWGWSTLHAPLPSMRRFSVLPAQDWKWMGQMLRGQLDLKASLPWSGTLKPVGDVSFFKKPVQAELVGGNLTVWASTVGTPYAANAEGKILFLEDIDETMYRIDRMLQQLYLSGAFRGVRAILLGNFLNCNDVVTSVLKKSPPQNATASQLLSPKPREVRPLRRALSQPAAIQRVFGELSQALSIPIFSGLPMGHGPEVSPLPLGARYKLKPSGRLELLSWAWLD